MTQPQASASASASASALPLDRLARAALVADGVLALVLGPVGIVTAAAQARVTGLPAELLLLAAVALVPYGVRAFQVGRRGVSSRGRVEGLVLFNAVWVLTLAGLLLGGWLQPTGLGVAVLLGHVVIPATVAVLTWRSIRRASTDQ